MKAARILFQLALLGAIACGIWFYFFPPPEKVIRKNLTKLAAAVSESPQGNISTVANVNRIGSFFHPEVSITVQGFGREIESITGRNELQQMALGARQNLRGIQLEFHNIHVEVAEDKQSARVILSATVRINDQTEPVVNDVKLTVEKVDRDWLIRTVEPVQRII